MKKDTIIVRGARANNLKNIDIDIPKQKIVVFTGVSGSGKSSLVFDTLAAEAGRQMNELFSAFSRARTPQSATPDADVIENLSAAAVIDQRRLGGNSRSTVGTITDLYAMLRMLFSRAGEPYIGYSNAFSFNHPRGCCPECGGVGHIIAVDESKMLDREKSLNGGAILFPTFAVGGYYWKSFTCSGFFDNDKPLKDYEEEEWNQLLYGKGKFDTVRGGIPLVGNFEGVIERFTRMFIQKGTSEISSATREKIEQYIRYAPCTACGGSRLNPEALSCKVGGLNIASMSEMEISRLIPVLEGLEGAVARQIAWRIVARLRYLDRVGLGYLTLSRPTSTLSGGESQRVKLVKHLGSSLTDMLYIFDEPTIGLHERDIGKIRELFLELRDMGDSVLIVEHDPAVIEMADHVVDMGPLAGEQGGQVVFEGTVDSLRGSGTVTGEHLRHRFPLNVAPKAPTGFLPLRGCSTHNLKHIDVDIPEGVFTAVTGVAGSGKTSLIMGELLRAYPEAVVVDQSAVGLSSRSNPATYTGVMDDVRKLFAKENGVSAALFSFNSKGACPDCQGLGYIYTELAFLETVRTLCEECHGRRFKAEVLEYKYRGYDIAQVLDMTVREALELFGDQPSLRKKLAVLAEVGLDYLTLGQPLGSLSGGECQRVKLAQQLHKKAQLYILDEPTTGLHMADTGRLLELIHGLRDKGNTVVVIEHNLDVIKSADWIIDLGPEGGGGGGQLLFSGTPADMAERGVGATAECLRGNGPA